VLGAVVLGIGTVVLLDQIRYLRRRSELVLQRWEPRMQVVHTILFLFLADAYSLFPGLQGVLRGLKTVALAMIRA
jgi:undecaprenyl-diphosphatase